MTTDVCEVVITAADADWLARFIRSLVVDRLAAAGHTFSPISSAYWWADDVQAHAEARATLHTRVELVPAIVERANLEHPYELPCVVAVPLIAGNPAYFDWIRTETTPQG
ncbi:periplasmic divalent cation tolerance protein [Saccharothrix saharensis]|uniref:Periplasmic divalent cation tolerance protein n=1 Tax=Saccharothrix saharensis TaxID=571190 RepID=A0A543JAZ6_9PSEU|nr:divalent-cation tolerance protein CutA [Saccharothrix saharensis]TQM80010.1 periplasmic divalent cation tolerance protein [Saccharothrix saharensis]